MSAPSAAAETSSASPITRYASGSNIYTSKYTLKGKIPVIRYVCCGCGYVENWVESPMELVQLHQTFGDR